jgi:histidinol dehydrogenase
MRIIRADNNKEYVFLKSLRSSALEQDGNIIKTVTDILYRVRNEGDKALIEYTKKFDGASRIAKYNA